MFFFFVLGVFLEEFAQGHVSFFTAQLCIFTLCLNILIFIGRSLPTVFGRRWLYGQEAFRL